MIYRKVNSEKETYNINYYKPIIEEKEIKEKPFFICQISM